MHTVITGANRGIGLEFCRQCRSEGQNVTALCRESSEELKSLDVKIVEGVDVRTPPDLDDLSTIDWLILNAGIWRDESLDDLNFETMTEQFEVNTLGPLRVLDKTLAKLKNGSKIIIITSRMGSIGDNTAGGRYGYRMSKAALNSIGVSLSHDLKPRGVAVGIYHPGYVATDMTRHLGTISPQESVAGLLKCIHQLNLENTGSFWDFQFNKLPW
ncbi:MAG: SDR family oxidoreductase [Candidatus Eremiobacteraeota bacterium]|nr:SDR family oxidoreductase [Candidatus Eremiobacteraeota bacterium]